MSVEIQMEKIPQAAAFKAGNPVARIGWRLETGIRWLTEVAAAGLVVAEVLLLFANVFYRYALHDPLVWGDELASLLFIWLAMLGSVIALRRGEHMRLTTFIARLAPPRRGFADTFGAVVVIAFILVLLQPAWEYTTEEWAITSAALEISNAFRVAAISVGLSLMLAISVARLMERASARHFCVSVLVVAGVAALLYVAKAAMTAFGNWNLVLFFVVGVVFMIVIGVPIMVAFGLSTVAYLTTVTSTPMLVVVGRMDEGMSGLILLAIPLFVFLGALIEAMGMANAMIRFLASLIGHLRGGLSYVLIGAIYLVSGISGSKAADMAAVAPALFPEMKKRGEDENELVAMLSASGAMSETIPPSLVLITIGSVTGVSISALFTGGFMPAVVGAMAMAAVVWFKNRRKDTHGVARAAPRDVGRAFLIALPALALPFVIRATVVEGWSLPVVTPADLTSAERDRDRHHSFARFNWFSDGWVARKPADESVLGDMRYSLSTAAFDPIWGIRFTPTDAAMEVEWVNRSPDLRIDIRELWNEIVGQDARFRMHRFNPLHKRRALHPRHNDIRDDQRAGSLERLQLL